MKKKGIWIVSLLLVGSIAAYFLLFGSDVETSTNIKNNKGESISYLSEENEKAVLKVFNFNHEKITKKLKIKQEKDLYSSSYYNPVEHKTIVITQQLEPYGYQVYLQDQSKFQNLGLLKEKVQEVVFTKDYIYALVYSNDASYSAKVKKYKLTQLDNPLKTWDIEGTPEKLLINTESEKIYVLTRTNKTLLYSLNKNEQFNSKEILEQGYDLNAYIDKGDLWILAREIIDNTSMKEKENTEVKSVFIIDPAKGVPKKEVPTKYQPKFIQMDEKRIYVITGTPNTSYLEIFDRKTYQAEKNIKLEAEVIHGFVSARNGKYIFTNKGIFKVQRSNLKKIIEEKVSPNIDLIIH